MKNVPNSEFKKKIKNLERAIEKNLSEILTWTGKKVPTGSENAQFVKLVRFAAKEQYEKGDFDEALRTLGKIPTKYRDSAVKFRIAQILLKLEKRDELHDYLKKIVFSGDAEAGLALLYFKEFCEIDDLTPSLVSKVKGEISNGILDMLRSIKPMWKRRNFLLELSNRRNWRDPNVGWETIKAQYQMRDFDSVLEEYLEHKTILTGNAISEVNKFFLLRAASKVNANSAYREVQESAIFQELKIGRSFVENTYLELLEKNELWNEAANLRREIEQSKGNSSSKSFSKSSFRWRKGFEFSESLEDSGRALVLDPSVENLVLQAGNLEVAGDYSRAAEIYQYIFEHEKPSKYYLHRAVFCFYKLGNIEAAANLLVSFFNEIDHTDCEPAFDENNSDDTCEGVANPDEYAAKKLDKIVESNWPLEVNGFSIQLARKALKEENFQEAGFYAKKALFEHYSHFQDSYEVLCATSLGLRDKKKAVQYFVSSVRPIEYQIDSSEQRKLSHYRRTLFNYSELIEFAPLEREIYFFESHLGARIDCNPLAICEKLLEDKKREVIVIWAIKAGTAIPETLAADNRVIFVERMSFVYWLALAIAGKITNNVTLPTEFIRRVGQKYLNTWHGTPIKTLGRDINTGFFDHGNSARNFVQASDLLFPNEFTRDIQVERYDARSVITAAMEVTGYPRNDILVNSSEKNLDLIKLLGLDPNVPIAFYAPTWRGGQGTEFFDVQKLIADLDHLSQTGYQILFRGHPHSQKYLVGRELNAVVPSDIYSSYELMMIADVLITDYSSIGVDFLATGRVTIWYCYDYEDYVAQRGLYFEPSRFPGIAVDTIDELCAALTSSEVLKNYDPSQSQKFVEFERGDAAARALELLDTDTPVPSQLENEKISILFRHSFMPNGITTALLGLISNLDPNKFEITVVFEKNRAVSDERIIQVLDSLPDNVSRIAYQPSVSTRPNWTAAERRVSADYQLINTFEADLCQAHAHWEARRLFGEKTFDVVVEFEGYSLFWAQIMSAVQCRGRRLYFLHSEMEGELKHRFPWLSGPQSYGAKYYNFVNLSGVLEKKNLSTIEKFSGEIVSESFVLDNTINIRSFVKNADGEVSDEFASWRDADRHLVVIAGRISIEKNQSFVVNVLKSVDKQLRPQVLIVGGGPLQTEIEEEVQQFDLQKDIFITGNVDNPIPYFVSGDSLLISSLHEGQPMVLHEAMAAGLQVATFPISGCIDWIERFGGQVINRSEESLKEYLEKLNGSESKAKNIHTSVERYSEEVIDKSIAKFNEIVQLTNPH